MERFRCLVPVTVDNGYTTVVDLARYMTVDSTTYNDDLATAINTASRQIDGYCGRFFYAASGVGHYDYKYYYSADLTVLLINDCITINQVALSTGANQTYNTVVPATGYVEEPLNGYADGLIGWPITRLRFTNDYMLPTQWQQYPNVRIYARWGWLETPEPVKQSCLIMAAEIFKLREAPFGVAGFADYGAVRVGKMSPQAVALLSPYRNMNSVAGMA